METQYEVVVVGGGSAGCAAVIAAARHGRQVLLIERYGFLGGTGASVLDSFYGFFTSGDAPRRVVGGIPWQVVRCLDSQGAMLLRPSSYGAGAGEAPEPDDHLSRQQCGPRAGKCGETRTLGGVDGGDVSARLQPPQARRQYPSHADSGLLRG
ncbi:MAG: FAD-dependent oxidoreductase [Chloroflexota bacterium]